jgi:hypothetical protein
LLFPSLDQGSHRLIAFCFIGPGKTFHSSVPCELQSREQTSCEVGMRLLKVFRVSPTAVLEPTLSRAVELCTVWSFLGIGLALCDIARVGSVVCARTVKARLLCISKVCRILGATIELLCCPSKLRCRNGFDEFASNSWSKGSIL